MAQLLQKTEEIQLNAKLSELKLEIKDKEQLLKEKDREAQDREREYAAEIAKLKQEVENRELLMKKQGEDKEMSLKTLKEGSLMQKRMTHNMQMEMRIMSGVLHNLGLEMFTRQQESLK